MKYRIVSPRLGTPGDPYEPEVWVNLQHLLVAGFIEPADDPAPADPKPAKTRTRKPTSEDGQ